MKVFDITYELNEETKVYEGDPHFIKEELFTLERDGFALSLIRMGTHAGTHTDAPSHFIEGGKSLLEIPLCNYFGECDVVSIEELEKLHTSEKIILKSTAAREARLTAHQAKALVDLGVRLVGTDARSIGDDNVHRILLENDIIIIELLRLEGIVPGGYNLYAMPLKIEADGSPIRACLIREDN